MRRHFATATLAASTLLTVGCIDTDATVFVEPTFEGATMTLEQSSLAAAVRGDGTLRFRLGSRAADASTVSLRGFSVTDAARAGTVVDRLAVSASPPFPLIVGVDEEVSVSVSFGTTDNTFDPAVADALCDPAGVLIVGAFDGSLRGGGIDVASAPIVVEGCP